MKENLNDKEVFFAQYWGQYIVSSESHSKDLYPLKCMGGTHGIKDTYLRLKPLSQITDEEIEKCVKIGVEAFNEKTYTINHTALRRDINDVALITPISDYLRSKGYLLPFRNYSTKDILELGWAKIK